MKTIFRITVLLLVLTSCSSDDGPAADRTQEKFDNPTFIHGQWSVNGTSLNGYTITNNDIVQTFEDTNSNISYTEFYSDIFPLYIARNIDGNIYTATVSTTLGLIADWKFELTTDDTLIVTITFVGDNNVIELEPMVRFTGSTN